MKLCVRCKTNEVLIISSTKEYSYCGDCKRLYDRNYYAKNQTKQRESRRINVRKIKIIRKNFIKDFLSTHPCVDCGEKDPIVLEFDHKDPETKLFNIGDATRSGYSIASIKEEIDKCEVRCANCHRRKTKKQFGY